MPLSTPPLVRLTPTGSTPLCRLYVYGARPPLDDNVCENAVPAVSVGRDAGETVMGDAEGVIVIVTCTSPSPVSEPSANSNTSVDPMPVDPLWL